MPSGTTSRGLSLSGIQMILIATKRTLIKTSHSSGARTKLRPLSALLCPLLTTSNEVLVSSGYSENTLLIDNATPCVTSFSWVLNAKVPLFSPLFILGENTVTLFTVFLPVKAQV